MDLCEFIANIRRRPPMYIGGEDLRLLYNYIAGFIYCLCNNGLKDELVDKYILYFNYFVQDRVRSRLEGDELRYNNGMSYMELIPYVIEDKGLQLKYYFECFDEFVEAVRLGIDFEEIKKRYK